MTDKSVTDAKDKSEVLVLQLDTYATRPFWALCGGPCRFVAGPGPGPGPDLRNCVHLDTSPDLEAALVWRSGCCGNAIDTM